jgi:hypothetical protein
MEQPIRYGNGMLLLTLLSSQERRTEERQRETPNNVGGIIPFP